MKITRIHSGRQIEEFFRELAEQHEHWRSVCDRTIELLTRLGELDDPREIFAVTSHESVCCSPIDDLVIPYPVVFRARSSGGFDIEYRLPPQLAPWPNAVVHGHANTGEEAVAMILIAMDKSEGWEKNSHYAS